MLFMDLADLTTTIVATQVKHCLIRRYKSLCFLCHNLDVYKAAMNVDIIFQFE